MWLNLVMHLRDPAKHCTNHMNKYSSIPGVYREIKDLKILCIFNDIQLHRFLSAYDFIEKGIVPIFHWLKLI